MSGGERKTPERHLAELSPALRAQLDDWRRRLAGSPELLELPADRPRRPLGSRRGSRVSGRVRRALRERLLELARGHGTTLSTVLLAAFKALLFRHSGQRDLLVGYPIAGRLRRETEPLVGWFVNTLVIRTEVAADQSFADLLDQVGETVLWADARREVPIERLVEELRPEHGSSHSPLFQVALAWRETAASPPSWPDLEIAWERIGTDTSKLDLTLEILDSPAGCDASIEYRTELFDRTTMARFLGSYLRLLEALPGEAGSAIGRLQLLGRAERHQLLAEWNDTRLPADEGLLHGPFEAQARRTPEAVALVAGERSLSYRELDRRANRLAHHLRSLGVGPEVRVAILLDRSPEMVVAMLAVLKAGGAYVPLDPAYPEQRLRFLLQDTAARVVLTCAARRAELPSSPAHLVCVDRDRAAFAAGSEAPAVPVAPDNLAYVIHTSGSTGRPKGVAIRHRSARVLLRWARETFTREELAVTLAATSICFDLSVYECFAPLSVGGRVVLVDNVLELPNLDPGAGITLVNTVPSAMNELLHGAGLPGSVAVVNLAGEVLGGDLARRVHGGSPDGWGPMRLWNLYGPSEDTTYSTAALVAADDRREPTIGRPVAETRCLLLDRGGRPVPVGVFGELCLGGAGLARGYLGRPGLTAEHFVPDPFAEASGGRLYRTGDLARFRSDGEIEFAGRIDHQVKIRGFRVEPGEVEAALAEHPAVRSAAVVVRREAGGDPRLVAYLVPEEIPGKRSPELAGELARYLGERLPSHMLPSAMEVLAALPLTPNGKVDRRALARRPLPTPAAGGGDPESAPRTPAEELLAGIWAEILGESLGEDRRVGRHDDFFDLGGHSLLATRMLSRVQEAFAVDCSLDHFFNAPTVAELGALLERRTAAGERPVEPAIERAPRDRPLPLSPPQQRLWFLDRLRPGDPSYNVALALDLEGRLAVPALAAALAEVVRRHEILRTRFPERAGKGSQTIDPPGPLPLPVVDLAALPAARRRAERRGRSRAEARRPFDLARGPVIRAILLRLGERRHRLLLTLHHIVCDAWSIDRLVGELSTLYGAFRARRPSPLAELPIRYADYAVWQRRWLESGELDLQLDYWRRRLADSPEALELPLDRPRPAQRSPRGSRARRYLPAALGERLAELGRRRRTTRFMILFAAFDALLYRTTGAEDLVVGFPIAGRRRRELEPLLGFFINTLVQRVAIAEDLGFGDLLQRVREAVLEAAAHQDVPFERVVEELRPERSLSQAPLVQVVFNSLTSPGLGVDFSGLDVASQWIPTATAVFDLMLEIEETPRGLTASIEYSSELFDHATIRRLLRAWERLLTAALENPEARLADLELLAAAERHQLLVEWNDTASREGGRALIHLLFSRQARRRPEAVAVTYGSESLSYGELERASDRLAARLRRQGVGPEAVVGLSMDRSPELIVALLGILKAGGAYLPLDPSYPAERLGFVLEDAGVSLVLGSRRRLAGLPSAGVRTVALDGGWDRVRQAPAPGESPDRSRGDLAPDNLAYVMYTSGSTGRPKGTRICHRAVVRLVRDTTYVSLTGEESLLLFAPISFDASTFEIWGALLTGGRLVVMAAGTPSLRQLGETLERHRITTLWLTSALFQQMVESELASLRGVRQLLTGGDVVPVPQAERLLGEVPGLCLINGFGPTENTTFTCCHPMRDVRQLGATVSIGRPIGDTRVYVLDRRLSPVPAGVVGELYCAGVGLARDYLERRGLTAERFVPHPWSREPGARLYRIGDRARHLADGRLEFLGRVDHQVKIRGFRIEPGEVEAVLVEHPAVRSAAVVVRRGAGGDKRLAAYLVPEEMAEEGSPGLVGELARYLEERLPPYMVPSAMEVLAALPLTPNGKVDRRALARRSPPTPAGAAAGDASHLSPSGGTFDSVPQTPTEELLAGLWAEVLGLPEERRIGRQDNFFHLGGHSLLATQVISRAGQAFGAELTVLELFEHPTLAAFAAAVDDAGRAERLPPLVSGPAEDEPPLSFTQERFWFLDQMTEGTNTYSVPFAVLLQGRLHVAALERFFAELSTRHEVLRATFPNRRGQPIQRISPPAGFTLPVVDLEGLARAEREAELSRLVSRAAQRPFDLARGPLMRAALVRLRERRHALLVGFHHIVADGWSVRVLIEEVQAVYGAFAEGRSSPLPPLPIQYRDYARWQRSWMGGEALAAEIAHWRRQLGERPPVLHLPRYPAAAGRPIPAVERFRLPAEVAAGLRGFSQRRDSTLFVTLLAAWGAVLGRYSGQARVVVGTVAANRNRVETEGLIGCFVNTLALAIDLSGDPTFDELVARVRRASFDAYAHQDLPFERLVEAYNPDRSSIQPLFQAFFTFEDAATQWPPLRLPDLEMRTLELASSGQLEAKFDLAMGVGDTPAGLLAGLGYNTAMYPAELVDGLVDDYRKTLSRLTEGSGARLSELPGPSEGERRALAERFPGAPAVGEPEKAAAPGKSERQQLAEKRSQLEERLAKLPPELRARFARRLGESGVDPGPRSREE